MRQNEQHGYVIPKYPNIDQLLFTREQRFVRWW